MATANASAPVAASLTTEKTVILAGTLAATICFGMIPIKLVIWNSGRTESAGPRQRRLKKVVTLANCFSGGVFVAACLLDLFPDVRGSIDMVLNEIENAYNTKIDYPVAEFVIVFGFFLVLIVEQIVMEVKENWRRPRASFAGVAVNAEDEGDALLAGQVTNYGTEDDENVFRSRYVSGQSHEDDGHDHDHAAAMFEEHSSLRSLVLLMALTFHSLFEGLAIGLQEENSKLISIFVAVIVHKGIMAFSLGLNLAQSHGMTVAYFVTANLIFSVASPVGMGIGIALSDLKKSIAKDLANGILQGIAGGTFLYITFFEVLPHEFASNQMRMPKLLCVLAGYSVICALLFLTH